jgi:hypothetical protein
LTSGSEAEDSVQLASGYNRSIYLMLAVPYLALGILGYVIVRQMRRQAPQGNGTFANENANERSTTPDGAT